MARARGRLSRISAGQSGLRALKARPCSPSRVFLNPQSSSFHAPGSPLYTHPSPGLYHPGIPAPKPGARNTLLRSLALSCSDQLQDPHHRAARLPWGAGGSERWDQTAPLSDSLLHDLPRPGSSLVRCVLGTWNRGPDPWGWLLSECLLNGSGLGAERQVLLEG